ncbi:MAG: uracil-DNA glycosylase [Sphingobacteriales bacterium]|nr:MAG: uracil-DNA glycosylase [Sphingobacteriales bacterium]
MDVKIEESWKEQLKEEFKQDYFKAIREFLRAEKVAGKTIYPAGQNIFNAFNTTPFDEVKVVILGQDPYHNPGQAHGLSFSVPKGVQPPPSLVNIFKEIHEDLGLPIPKHGNLEHWAKQGVLLLNAALTVEAHKPMSHSKVGWHHFTDDVIRIVSEKKEHVVFILWGAFAKGKAVLIDTNKHLVLTSAHPSPLSAHNGFFGSKHFSKANKWLEQKGLGPIDWSLD